MEVMVLRDGGTEGGVSEYGSGHGRSIGEVAVRGVAAAIEVVLVTQKQC